MIDWSHIESVFLDMDGTLLDLHFDNYFWREFVPQRYATMHNIVIEDAKNILFAKFKNMEGTMDWYCVDYWSKELALDIAELKREIKHLIRIRPNTIQFLDFLKKKGHRLVLVTNAHIKSLALKMEITQLQGHFDRLVCAHEIGLPKENILFWDKLKSIEYFDNQSTLLVDDSLPVLKSARQYGIKFLLAVSWPDSKAGKKEIKEFDSVHCFSEIISGRKFNP